jgi:hypothetical protein
MSQVEGTFSFCLLLCLSFFLLEREGGQGQGGEQACEGQGKRSGPGH